MSISSPATTVICEDAILEGPITFGPDNVIHPKCVIRSEGGGEIVFGRGNIVEESAVIVNRSYLLPNAFEGSSVGTGCTIEARANVSVGTTLGDNSVIGAKCHTRPNQIVPNDTVIFGESHTTRTQNKSNRLQANLHSRHLEYLREVPVLAL
ncbi:hypothetical protein SpCBS45565_g06758 [Spizellomyces sp. 'palustris']|nr:hypothetical protein SpCBS45565_g06758 [Spizellomyces sp. 'palustris']